MTPLECTLLVSNLVTLLPLFILGKDNRNLEKENRELWEDTLKFSEETLIQIDKLQVALEDCKKKQIIKSKAPKNEKKTTSK
jgi:hypothetical protein